MNSNQTKLVLSSDIVARMKRSGRSCASLHPRHSDSCPSNPGILSWIPFHSIQATLASSFSLREKVRMREPYKPLIGVSYSLTLLALTPTLSRGEREFTSLVVSRSVVRNVN